MRTPLIVLAALTTLGMASAQAAQMSQFNKDCLETESNMMSVQPATLSDNAQLQGEVCHYGQLTREDLSYVQSVQPSHRAPLQAPRGEVCHYGQLTREDLSYVQSVQPAEAGAPAAE
jgi:hypothetical protein